MKTFSRILTAVAMAALMALTSCRKAPAPQEEQLPVTFFNTSGVWELTQWSGGDISGTPVSITLKEKKFTLVQSVGSMYPATYTGTYNLIRKEGGEVVIRGIYDYTWEYWAHNYRIVSLTASEMVWVSEDDEKDVYTYRKID